MIMHHHCSACLEHGCLLFFGKRLPVKSSLHIISMLCSNEIASDSEVTAQHMDAEGAQSISFSYQTLCGSFAVVAKCEPLLEAHVQNGCGCNMANRHCVPDTGHKGQVCAAH